MDRVEFEPVGQKREMKAVLYFVGKDKGLVLNKTNANKITELSGSGITEEWHGVKVRLYATETQFGGDTVDCIRIKAVSLAKGSNGARRPALPVAPPPPPPPVEEDGPDYITDDDIPF